MKLTFDDILKNTKIEIKKSIIECILYFIVSIFTYFIYYEKALFFSVALICIGIISILFSYREIRLTKRLMNCKNTILKEEIIILYSIGEYILTENYFISFQNKKIYMYEDILLTYKRISLLDDRIYLYIVIKNGKTLSYEGKAIIDPSLKNENKYSNHDFTNLLLEKNPNILIGNTKNNRKILKEEYGIILFNKTVKLVLKFVWIIIEFFILLFGVSLLESIIKINLKM